MGTSDARAYAIHLLPTHDGEFEFEDDSDDSGSKSDHDESSSDDDDDDDMADSRRVQSLAASRLM